MVEKKFGKGALMSLLELNTESFHTHLDLTAYPIAASRMKVVLGNTQIEVKGGLLKRYEI